MTDAYPPFRLDQGGSEGVAFYSGAPPAAGPTTSAPTTSAPTTPPPAGPATGTDLAGSSGAPPAPRPTSSWTPGPVTTLVLGALAVLLGLAGVVGGGALLAGDSLLRDDGYLTTPTWRVGSDGYAVTSEDAVLAGAWLDEGLGDVRLRAVGLGEEVFLGVATADDAAAYLDGVERTVVTGSRQSRDIAGSPPAVPPEQAGIWVASTSGPGEQTLKLAPQPGTWVAVLMPADGQPGVQATVDVGATLPWLDQAAAGTLLFGVVLLGLGALAMTFAVRAATPTQ